ncbi:GPD2, partial [Symbiodinium pilosum]
AGDVLSCVEESQVKGSRSGLYKHYPRLYEGAAATTGYPYLEAEVRYAVNQEYAVTPADVLARRTRLAFLNSTAARLCLPRVVEIMAECLGWSDARALEEHERAEQILARDFAGPVPNKVGALLRTACTADVKDVFDKIDVEGKGTLTKAGIAKAAAELGFPLSQAELQKAINEMDTDRNGEVHFPEFLAWWNSSEKSKDVQKKIYMGSRAGSRWKTIEE